MHSSFPEIIFEDGFFMVISKPPGMVVNNSESTAANTLQQWSENKLGINSSDDSGDFHQRAGIVHRLDKDTSGLILIAKTSDIFSKLQDLFLKRLVSKTYHALVHGDTPLNGTINAPVGRLKWDRMKFGVIADGREALTLYKKKETYVRGYEKYSFVEVKPETGRTHQIRIHFKHMGFPLVSDPLYSGRKVYKNDLLFCPRLFLHAFGLQFVHPQTGKEVFFTSPLPPDLQTVLGSLIRN